MVREASRPVREGKWCKCNIYSCIRAIARCRMASFSATRTQGQAGQPSRLSRRVNGFTLGLLSADSQPPSGALRPVRVAGCYRYLRGCDRDGLTKEGKIERPDHNLSSIAYQTRGIKR